MHNGLELSACERELLRHGVRADDARWAAPGARAEALKARAKEEVQRRSGSQDAAAQERRAQRRLKGSRSVSIHADDHVLNSKEIISCCRSNKEGRHL